MFSVMSSAAVPCIAHLLDDHSDCGLGLVAWLRHTGATIYTGGARRHGDRKRQDVTGAVVFGSDQGLAGQFNKVLGLSVPLHLHVYPIILHYCESKPLIQAHSRVELFNLD